MNSRLKSWAWRWGPAVLIMVIIFLASSTPGDDLPQFGAFDFSLKKAGHAFGYALLALGLLRGLSNGKDFSRREWLLALLLSMLYAVSDECHQILTPGRTPSPIDVMIDTGGAAMGLAVWTVIRSVLLA